MKGILRTRVAIPADGVFTEIPLGGLFYYVVDAPQFAAEQLPDICPDNPSGDGIPLIHRSWARFCAPGFHRLFLRGSGAEVGTEIELMIVSDPCANIILPD